MSENKETGEKTIAIKVPVLPESVLDANVAKWYKKEGDVVLRDEHLVDLETDKVILEVCAESEGILGKIESLEGSTVLAQAVLGYLYPNKQHHVSQIESFQQVPPFSQQSSTKDESPLVHSGPAARRLAKEKDLTLEQIQGTGKHGSVTISDIQSHLEKQSSASKSPLNKQEHRVPMTRLRARIAQRLLDAQHNSAILTTFNEVDMLAVMNLRKKYKDLFEQKHKVRLGFMSFFVKAVVQALKQFSILNASIDGQDILYHDNADIGIAVSSPRGLVVPILREAQSLSLAQIESKITDLGLKAKEGTLGIEEITGGTFTISNGGVFGSLLSTPILNPPQSGILGMHKIQERPVVENGQIVIRPMMYLALSYDHRLIDGSDSVRFLVAIKELIEDPARLLLDL